MVFDFFRKIWKKKKAKEGRSEKDKATRSTDSASTASTAIEEIGAGSAKTSKTALEGSSKKQSRKNKKQEKATKKQAMIEPFRPNKSSSTSESSAKSTKFSFRSFRKNRAKDLKKVATFVSRPFRRKALVKMLARVNKRNQNKLMETTARGTSTTTGNGVSSTKVACEQGPALLQKPIPLEPSMKSEVTKRLPKAKENVIAKKNKKNGIAAGGSPPDMHTAEDDPDWKNKYPPVLTNNTNNGNLLMPDGRPFWHRAKKNENDQCEEDEDSDDELPMNSDVLNDVYEGRIVLAEMPNVPMQLDPFGPLVELKKQTLALCTRDILMGNSVRTMVNMCDDDEHRWESDNKKQAGETKKVPTFVEPTQLILYDRGRPKQTTRTVQLNEFRVNSPMNVGNE